MPGTKENISWSSVFDRDTVLHLRIPFSFYLLPVFCFGISQASVIHIVDTVIFFIALHLFIYPGSNCYNSYMDNDTGSIGGLENPPPVTKRLYYASIIVDVAGLLLCLISGWKNMAIVAGYVAFSKAYSWHGIRMKKLTYLGWLAVTFFQGGYTYLMAGMVAENNVSMAWFTPKNMECMIFASLIIGGSYPLTQIYQHEEDSLRGDYTISYRLGITRTFIFTSVLFAMGAAIILHYFVTYYQLSQFFIFLCCLAPVIIYFSYWFFKCTQNKAYADYRHAMLMNKISAICMIVCFTVILLLNHPSLI